MKRNLIRAALVVLGLATGAIADDGKMITCPSASALAIGTASNNRLELAFKNEHASNDICVSTRSTMTCNGTVGTDGFHCDPGLPCFWFTETSTGSPAFKTWYCRAATGDSPAGIMELVR
jgi:hypothetical protein